MRFVATIAILAAAVADQIAAGEVIERPASVVKELLENAVDAGARTIDVIVVDGGRGLISVSDDGCGMDQEDALLSLARHGTSKIRTSDDLTGVATFGFRGEALPAICSISELEIETAVADGAGTSLRAAGGSRPVLEPVMRRRGTTVRVSRLFYNVPARAKFLRGARSEWRAISDTLTTLALTRRDIRIEATHDGRRALRAPAATTMRARIASLWGVAEADDLLAVEDVCGSTLVSGLVERPASVGAGTRRTFLSVNGRAIRDTGLIRAAELAYRSTIPSGVRPSLFLEIVLPADSVDVNVHPAKAEIRFRDRWDVERAVERAVRLSLGNFASAGSFGRSFLSVESPLERDQLEPMDLLRASAPQPLFASPGEPSRFEFDVATGAPANQGAPTPATVAATIPPLHQLHLTYIMLEREGGLVFIDQHSAHERVLYEAFMRVLEGGGAASQRLLLPITLTLATAQLEAYELHRSHFDRLGFEVEQFGGNSLIIHAVPTPHPRFDAERCLRDTLAAITGDRASGVAARHENLVATIACKAAIKSGDALGQDEMRALYIALLDTHLPAHDVHGRSTIVQLGWDEVDRRFGRS